MKRIVIKYGGNAMRDKELQSAIVRKVIELKDRGMEVVIVHGGGPFIARQLDQAGISSKFADGHRITTEEAMPHIEMALKGLVNGQLISLFNKHDSPAIGISGKDVQIVTAVPRIHKRQLENGDIEEIDLGQVGDVVHVQTPLLEYLLNEGITPVIACIGTGADGTDYNINGDMMAGHIAGALGADHFIVLTDIDGLRKDVSDPESHIEQITSRDIDSLMHTSIKGGMIPKIEACLAALEAGAKEACILNGMHPDQLTEKLLKHKHVGTNIIS